MTRSYLLVSILFLAGCSSSIPNKVTAEEYALYTEWTRQHFASKNPERLFLASRTFIFDPLQQNGCGNTLHADHVPWSLIKQLHALGQAEYPLDFYPPTSNMHISWFYKEVDGLPPDPPGTYSIVGFSRVAFNRDHTQALFAISDSCGGMCGGGGARFARRENGKWVFRNAACIWVY